MITVYKMHNNMSTISYGYYQTRSPERFPLPHSKTQTSVYTWLQHNTSNAARPTKLSFHHFSQAANTYTISLKHAHRKLVKAQIHWSDKSPPFLIHIISALRDNWFHDFWLLNLCLVWFAPVNTSGRLPIV